MTRHSGIDEIRQELALLQVEHKALLKSYRKLALRTLGDTPQTAEFLEEMKSDVVENYPEWLK